MDSEQKELVMTSILDNELVNKYFPCPDSSPKHQHNYSSAGWCRALQADLVLRAMQEPIKYGEDYLSDRINEIWNRCHNTTNGLVGFHPHELRLPDKFQKRECECAKTDHEYLDEIEREIAKRDYGEWGKDLLRILRQRKCCEP